jgi:hypothetical protein
MEKLFHLHFDSSIFLQIQRQLARSRLLQDQLEDFRKRHEKLEKKRNEVDLDDYFSRQFRLRLQIRSKTVIT